MRFLIATTLLSLGCGSTAPALPPPPAEHAVELAKTRKLLVRHDASDEEFSGPLSTSDAERILGETEIFDLAGSGYSPRRQVQAFNVLLDQPDALTRFQRLSLGDGLVGRLYALCGLLLLDRREGAVFAQNLSLNARGSVTVRQGDFLFETPAVRAIVLVFADEVPARLRARREESYRFFGTERKR